MSARSSRAVSLREAVFARAGVVTTGIDLTVRSVGFKVDPAARDQLSCIAAASGGT